MPKGQSYIALLSVVLVGFLVFVYFRYLLRSPIFSSGKGFTGFFMGKAAGFLLFGLVPFLILYFSDNISPADAGFTAVSLNRYIMPVVAIAFVATLSSWYLSGISAGLKNEGSVNVKPLNFKNMFVISAGWSVYILGYEFLFRGVLWFLCYSAFGFMPALVINVILYALAHLGQGKLISAGSVPVGVILCLLAHLTGTFLIPFVIHCTMAVSYELFTAYNASKVTMLS